MFAHEISNEDTVLSPKTDTRELMVGKVTGRYDHNTQTIGPDYPHARRVRWVTTRGFDLVPREIWRSMTAWQTVFELSTEVALQATQQILGGEQLQPESQEVRVAEEALNFLTETGERANEILATHFDSFSGMEFQEIVVATLKAAGLFTRPIRRGRDQGIDVEAYRDPLLLGPPRVLVQVKHRQGQVSGPEMREFLGTMNRDGDVGLYISTGGFGREATTAAERHQRPVRLMGWEDFVQMFLRFYDNLDNEFKARVPLENVRVLRPPDETG
jgi:restriction system protein